MHSGVITYFKEFIDAWNPLVHDHTIRNFNSLRLKVLNDAWEIGDYNSHSFGLILANCKVIWWMNGLSSSVSKNDMFVGRRTPWRPHHPHCASMMRGREWRQPATAWRRARRRWQRSCTAPRSLPELRGLSAGVVGVVAALCGVLLLLVLLRALYKLQRGDGGGGGGTP